MFLKTEKQKFAKGGRSPIDRMMDWRSQSRNQIYTRGSQGKSTDRVERLDKMPKIVRFLAIDQEGVITVWPWRGPHAIYLSLLPRFFFWQR
jgi:hypothetical protein